MFIRFISPWIWILPYQDSADSCLYIMYSVSHLCLSPVPLLTAGDDVRRAARQVLLYLQQLLPLHPNSIRDGSNWHL